MTWEAHQKFESDWHGDCISTEFGERLKQTAYARKMGLRFEHDGKSSFSIDCRSKSIVDVGGGPYSMLLFCRNVKGTVVDPCEYPEWISKRYIQAGIDLIRNAGEAFFNEKAYNECWIYNCLQHVKNPQKVIENAHHCAGIIRVFEWINIPPCPGHPHELSADKLDEWLGGDGKVEIIDDRERGLCGTAYYGIFKTK